MTKIADSKQNTANGGYTLIELMVSIGLFAIVMVLVAGAYLMIVSVSQQGQAISTAVDGVSFALEDVTRTIRTGTAWSCSASQTSTDCRLGGTVFTVTDQAGTTQTYSMTGGVLYQQTNNGTAIPLTDPSFHISSLEFYVVGTKPYGSSRDVVPPHMTMVVSGTITVGKATFPLTVETGATMRGIDL